MSTESNVATLKDAYQRWHDTKAGSVDHWLNLMTDDIQFQSLAAGAIQMKFTRPSCCKDDVKQYFAGLTNEWEMIYYRVDEYIAQGDRVVALSQVSFRHKKPVRRSSLPKPISTSFVTARSVSFSSSMTQRAR